eukprot:TRINITY_DN1610_c0_g1_i1.p2 TRINITY_DN1610_c0_g1~~TRINITY_DN1610_c0_g1_i1.p2  ORF type:complete len:323 (+),score=123.40 TRINITY_DN1610_c0_g1_i1:64-1032(+)
MPAMGAPGDVSPLMAAAAARMESRMGERRGSGFKVFCQWLVQSLRLDDVHVVAAVILLERVFARCPAESGLVKKVFGGPQGLYWRERLFGCALLVSIKTLCDGLVRNRGVAALLSVPLAQFNALERAFVCFVDFEMFVGEKEFRHCAAALRAPTPAHAAAPHAAAAKAALPTPKHHDILRRAGSQSNLAKSPRHLPASPQKTRRGGADRPSPFDAPLLPPGKRRREETAALTHTPTAAAADDDDEDAHSARKRASPSSSASDASSAASSSAAQPPAKRARRSCATASLLSAYLGNPPQVQADVVCFAPMKAPRRPRRAQGRC